MLSQAGHFARLALDNPTCPNIQRVFGPLSAPAQSATVNGRRVVKFSGAIVPGAARREQASALLAAGQNDFLIRMGVSRKPLTEVMYQQTADTFQGADKSTLRCLTPDEMQRYNVVNADWRTRAAHKSGISLRNISEPAALAWRTAGGRGSSGYPRP